MQLPRGRFDRFVRDGTVLGIIKELGDNRYSGRCSGIIGGLTAELIFEDGIIILAESSANNGAETLHELHSSPGGIVTAELSVYDSSQLKLAREFNSGCIVPKEGVDPLFSDIREGTEAVAESSAKETDRKSGDEAKEAVKEEYDCKLNIDRAEIESIVTNFRSGARDLLKKINLEHLMIDGRSGENDND